MSDASETENMKNITFICGKDRVNNSFNFSKMYSEVFATLGYNFKEVNINLARALNDVNEGKMDGLCSRVADFENYFDNNDLVRVKVALRETKLMAWSKSDSIVINSPKDLNTNKLIVSYVRGAIVSENFAKQHHLQSVVKMPTLEGAMKLVYGGKVDIVIAGEDFVLSLIEQNKLEALHPVAVLKTYRTYPYLHKSKAHLLPELETALRRYKLNETTLLANINEIVKCPTSPTDMQ